MTPEQIEYLIYQYDLRAEKAVKEDIKSEWRRYSRQSKLLKKWRDEDSAKGDCPVNYEEDGLTLDGADISSLKKVEAESKVDHADSLYNEANEAFKKEDWGKTKQIAGELARLGDSRGEEIITAVDLRSGDGGNKVDAGTLQKIKIALRNLDNIKVLGDGVRDAEQIRARGQADEELLTLLKDARTRWDEMRESHGQILEKSRNWSVADRAEAVEDLNGLILTNQLTVWDHDFDTCRKTSEVLTEVRHEWEMISHEAVEKEIEIAQQNIPHRLDSAKERLENAYNLTFYSRKEKQKPESERKPTGFVFHENDRAELRRQLDEIEAMITQRDKAEELVEQARDATSPEQSLKFLLDARSQWPHLVGLERRITELREDATRLLAERMRSKISEAERALDVDDFDKASKALTDAKESKATFPGEPLPILLEALAKVEAVEQIVREAEEIRRMR